MMGKAFRIWNHKESQGKELFTESNEGAGKSDIATAADAACAKPESGKELKNV